MNTFGYVVHASATRPTLARINIHGAGKHNRNVHIRMNLRKYSNLSDRSVSADLYNDAVCDLAGRNAASVGSDL
jgi:hypothetical protein